MLLKNKHNFTRSIAVSVPTNIIKYNRALDFEVLTRSLTVYVKKNIIKYIRPLNSYNVTKCFSVSVKDKKYLKDSIPLYKNNLSREILIYNPKYIIKFISTTYKKPKVILDSPGFDNADANADENININTKYLNIFLIFGLVLSVAAPSLIYKMTGVNIYEQIPLTETIYSKFLCYIRITCANVFVSFIICLWLSNIERLNLSIFNKPIMCAPLFVAAGDFDKLGDPDQNAVAEDVTTKPMSNKNK
jgi:hypothetical protein